MNGPFPFLNYNDSLLIFRNMFITWCVTSMHADFFILPNGKAVSSLRQRPAVEEIDLANSKSSDSQPGYSLITSGRELIPLQSSAPTRSYIALYHFAGFDLRCLQRLVGNQSAFALDMSLDTLTQSCL